MSEPRQTERLAAVEVEPYFDRHTAGRIVPESDLRTGEPVVRETVPARRLVHVCCGRPAAVCAELARLAREDGRPT